MNILIVDDQLVIRDVAAKALRKQGHCVVKVANGEMAIKIAECNREIDLVFCDIVMVGIGGLEVCQIIKKMNPSIHFCVLTGYSQSYSEQEARKVGADCFLPKPFSLSELVNKVKEVAANV